MRSMRDEQGRGEWASPVQRAPAGGATPFADREVAIVPDGEPAQGVDPWARLTLAIAARRGMRAPDGMCERIMAAIGELPGR